MRFPFFVGGYMKVLVFRWASVTNHILERMFHKFGCETYVVTIPFNNFQGDEKLKEKMVETLEKDDYDFVFSINYFDMISEACHEKGVKYVAWTYDSPAALGGEDLRYDTTYLFMFDKEDVERAKKLGADKVFYLPLAVDTDYFDSIKILSKKHEKIIRSDISFVGNMYETRYAEAAQYLDDYYKAYLNALVDAQLVVGGKDVIRKGLNLELLNKMCTPEFNRVINAPKRAACLLPLDEPEELDEKINQGMLILVLNQTVTNKERLLVLELLAKHHHLKLFTPHKHEVIKNAVNCGFVDYKVNMPKVFKSSKINMNISVRTFSSAIPLRCLDVMGCGGFLMTNHQAEMDDYFVNGRDLAIYTDPEDALDKANYYLNPKHETERQTIARNGYEIVKEHFNYHKMFSFIWEKAELGVFPPL